MDILAVLGAEDFFAARQVADDQLAAPVAAGKLAAVGRISDRVDRPGGLIRARAELAEVHEPAPFPVAELRLALVQELQRVVECVVVDLGGGQADLGYVRFIFLRFLGLDRDALLFDGDFFLLFRPLFFTDGDVFLLASLSFGSQGGFLLLIGDSALLGFLLLCVDGNIALVDCFLLGDDRPAALLIDEIQGRRDDDHDRRHQRRDRLLARRSRRCRRSRSARATLILASRSPCFGTCSSNSEAPRSKSPLSNARLA